MLDKLLQYHQEPEDSDFTRTVLRKIRKTDQVRKIILWCSGIIGSAFGVAGVIMLKDSLVGISVTLLVSNEVLQFSVGLAGIFLILFAWLLNEGFE